VNQIKLDQLDSESQILSLLTSDISTLLTVESILLSAGDALSRSIQYQRLAIYQIEDARVSAKLIYVSGDYSTIVPMNTVVPLAELMSRDPFDDAMMSLDEGPVKDRPIQIVHDHVGDSAQQIAVIRIWSSTKPELATSESRILDSVTTRIVPALKRAALQGKF
jgi:hypothetical protein